MAIGQAVRVKIPRDVHAAWDPAADRPDPVDLLEVQAATRLPELVPIRYGRMLYSPFAFYRGAAVIMASDLATLPNTGLHVQLCGDAHLANFGGFASPERDIVFDINDFDETLPGPWEWDVKRLAASVEIAGRERGFDAKHASLDRLGDRDRVPKRPARIRQNAQSRGLVRLLGCGKNPGALGRHQPSQGCEEDRGKFHSGSYSG